MSFKLFLMQNDTTNRWEVLDNDVVVGDGETKRLAIKSARLLTQDDIWDYEAQTTYMTNPKESDIFTASELIEELARLADMRVTFVKDDKMKLRGYKMGLRE